MGALLDLLFPPRCAGCADHGWPLCGRCGAEAGVVTPPWCARCGRPWEESLTSCSECPPRPVDAVRAPFVYEGPIARALRGVKFSGWRAVAAELAPAMAEVFDLEGEVVTWVPLARRRRARRGFDQAEVLARAVAPRVGLPAVRMLRRIKETPPQARRPGGERRRSLQEAFVAEGSVPASVVLVDDVVTTGATAAACAEALRRNGARAVAVLALARSLRGPPPARCYASGPTASGKGEDAALL